MKTFYEMMEELPIERQISIYKLERELYIQRIEVLQQQLGEVQEFKEVAAQLTPKKLIPEYPAKENQTND